MSCNEVRFRMEMASLFFSLSFDFSKPWESGLEHRINIEIIVIISVDLLRFVRMAH